MNDSDSSYVLYETLRSYANFQGCPRGAYLNDVEGGKSKEGRKVPDEETLAHEKKMKKLQRLAEKKQQKDERRKAKSEQ